MTSKRLLEQLYIASKIGITSKENGKILKDYYKVVLRDLNRFEELVKVIRILKTRKYAEWIKNKFYDGVGYDEEEEKLFEKVFGSSWRKY